MPPAHLERAAYLRLVRTGARLATTRWRNPQRAQRVVATRPGAHTGGVNPDDTAWLIPLIGGSLLAVLLGAALVLVLLLGRRRK